MQPQTASETPQENPNVPEKNIDTAQISGVSALMVSPLRAVAGSIGLVGAMGLASGIRGGAAA
jgi:hypothetical protein